MDEPAWITLSNLGSYDQNHSFDLSPIVLSYSAGSGSKVTNLNGKLAEGLQWQQIVGAVEITGAATASSTDIDSTVTFRITQPDGQIADRTFSLKLAAEKESPSWALQPGFLGYQSNTQVQTYQLHAEPPPNNLVIYEVEDTRPIFSIDRNLGILSVNPTGYTTNANLQVVVRATADLTGAYSNVAVDLGIVSILGPPRWVSSSLDFPTYYSTDFVEMQLRAEDPIGIDVSYNLVSQTTGLGLVLSNDGVLHGTLPYVTHNTIYSLTARCTGHGGSSDCTFLLEVLPSIIDTPISWVSEADLGSIIEGDYVSLDILAMTDVSHLIIYNVTGGMLPPHLMLGTTDGRIQGCCEYHAISKTYFFDITATIYGLDISITKTFKVTVEKRYADQFLKLYIPLENGIKDTLITDSGNVRVREPGTIIYDTISNISGTPELSLINGVITDYDGPDQVVQAISPWMNELSLAIGPAGNTYQTGSQISSLFRMVVDYQRGANLTALSHSVMVDLVYPISIENIRQSLEDKYNFVSSGNGTELNLIPIIDYNDGSIKDLIIAEPGSEFLMPPEIQIYGSGTGAEAKLVLGLTDAVIIDGGSRWNVGDLVYLRSQTASIPAVLEVTAIGNFGEITAFTIINNGDYSQVPFNTPIYSSNLYSYVILSCTWGVVAAKIISSGTGYECNVSVQYSSGEILPYWQDVYFPAIYIGNIPQSTAGLASELLNAEPSTLFGTPLPAKNLVLQWQGLRWLGETTFEDDLTTFDGMATRFQETETPYETVFDKNKMSFDTGMTLFDWQDGMYYDLFQVWGSTLIDSGTTIFDLYSTIFDTLRPKPYSNTRLQKLIPLLTKTYTSSNAIY
jgi:hypothetical protein